MNKWLKVLLWIFGFISVIGVIIAAVFFFTSGMVDSADGFFTAVKQKDMATARTYLSEDFKASTDEKALTEFLSKSAILNFKEASWSNREINNGRGNLEGSITTESGGVVPIKIAFVKENEAWKIYAIEKTTAGLQSEPASASTTAAPALPDKTTQIALVKQAMHDFLLSVAKKDMTHFRSTVSNLWQEQFTIEKFNEVYKPITDSQGDWSVIENFEPELSADAKIDEQGVLILAGHYPTQPSQVEFGLKYLYEGTAWKLVGFSINAK